MFDYIDIQDAPHKMWAEGTSENKPNTSDVENVIKQNGYNCENVSISYDSFQGMYRFTARLLLLLT